MGPEFKIRFAITSRLLALPAWHDVRSYRPNTSRPHRDVVASVLALLDICTETRSTCFSPRCSLHIPSFVGRISLADGVYRNPYLTNPRHETRLSTHDSQPPRTKHTLSSLLAFRNLPSQTPRQRITQPAVGGCAEPEQSRDRAGTSRRLSNSLI